MHWIFTSLFFYVAWCTFWRKINKIIFDNVVVFVVVVVSLQAE